MLPHPSRPTFDFFCADILSAYKPAPAPADEDDDDVVVIIEQPKSSKQSRAIEIIDQ